MGLISAVTDCGKGIAQNKLATSSTNYVYKTITYLCEQVGAAPRLIHTFATDAPSRAVPAHLMRISIEDLAPLILLPYASHLILQKVQELLENTPKSDDWLSAETAINTAILLLHVLTVITWIYSFRAKIEFIVRSLAVSLEAPILLNREHTTTTMTVCKDEGCTQLRFLKGAVRDLVAYEATEALIYCIRLLSPLLANTLLIFHRGNYLLTLALPSLCNRHQVAYLWKHSDLALSLGLGHMLSTWMLNTFVEGLTGIPSTYYYKQLDLFALIFYIGIATHITLPQASQNTTTSGFIDPIAYYQKGIGVVFDALVQKLKTNASQLLNIKQYHRLNELFMTPSWSKLSIARNISWHVLAYIFLPPMLQSTHTFIRDPIIRTNWPTLQNAIVYALKEASAAKTHVAVRTLSFFPAATGVVAWATLGVPSALTKFVLQLITNDDFVYQLNRWQEHIERLSLNKVEPIAPRKNTSMPLLRGQIQVSEPKSDESNARMNADTVLPPADKVIKLSPRTQQKNTTPPEASDWEMIPAVKSFTNEMAVQENPPTQDVSDAPFFSGRSSPRQLSDEWVSIQQSRFFTRTKDSESWLLVSMKSREKEHNHIKRDTSL